MQVSQAVSSADFSLWRKSGMWIKPVVVARVLPLLVKKGSPASAASLIRGQGD